MYCLFSKPNNFTILCYSLKLYLGLHTLIINLLQINSYVNQVCVQYIIGTDKDNCYARMTNNKSTTVAHKVYKFLFFKQIFLMFGPRERYPLPGPHSLQPCLLQNLALPFFKCRCPCYRPKSIRRCTCTSPTVSIPVLPTILFRKCAKK